jgi:PIN domain nuclease of toxin-antitoxin system
MKVLLDTHCFLWLVTGDDRLSETARVIFLNPDNRLFFSAASFWEICVKKNLGKIVLQNGWLETIQNEMTVNTIEYLQIEIPHCFKVTELPFHHRDPFDRMLVAQAMVEDMQLLSSDSRLSAYAVTRIW